MWNGWGKCRVIGKVSHYLYKAKISSITNHIDKELLSVYLDRGVVRFSDVDEKRTNVTSLDLSKYQLVRKGNLVFK